jgi:hypothetical protein
VEPEKNNVDLKKKEYKIIWNLKTQDAGRRAPKKKSRNFKGNIQKHQ